MKVLAISGSPRPQGNTRLLLETALKVLEGHGIATEYLSLHGKDIRPCQACMKCAKDKNRCAQEDDFMPVFEAMAAADGLLVGSPVYFGSATPNLMALLDRAGFVARLGDNRLRPEGGQPHRGGPPGRGQFHLCPTAIMVLHRGESPSIVAPVPVSKEPGVEAAVGHGHPGFSLGCGRCADNGRGLVWRAAVAPRHPRGPCGR